MNQPLHPALPADDPDLQALQAGVRNLPDDRLKRVVMMVDGLPERGAVDELLEPLRPRLAALRPPRRPTLRRLLFNPMEPLLVPRESWQRGELSFPRHALPPLARLVFEAMGEDAEVLRRRVDHVQPGDDTALLPIGAQLWPAAGAVLKKATMPSDWSEAGMADADFPAIQHDMSTLLRHAVQSESLIRQARVTGHVAEASLVDLLENMVRDGGAGFGLMSLLLTARLQQISVVMRATRRVAEMSDNARLATVADFVMDKGLISIQDKADEVVRAERPVGAVADGLELLFGQLAAMEESTPASRTDRRRRIDMMRRQIEHAARHRFGDTLQHELLDKLSVIETGGKLTSQAVQELESKMRGLRRLGEAGSMFGDPKIYDEMLRSAVATVAALPEAGGFTLVDRVRMVELMQDSDKAISLLQRQRTQK
jgi:hypothetical protein